MCKLFLCSLQFRGYENIFVSKRYELDIETWYKCVASGGLNGGPTGRPLGVHVQEQGGHTESRLLLFFIKCFV